MITVDTPHEQFGALEAAALGELCLREGRFADAVEAFDRVISQTPAYAPAHFYRGLALFSLGRLIEAAAAYDTAVYLQPCMFEAYNNLGITLQLLAGLPSGGGGGGGKLEAALSCHDRAIAIEPHVADLHNCRGNCLVSMMRPDEALAAFERCLTLDAAHPQANNNKAILLHRQNRHAEALTFYDRAIDEAEARGFSFDDAHYNRGLLLLTLGDFGRGWGDYEYRIPDKWVGSLPRPEELVGKLLYVYGEQGYGDTLQFVRYLPLLRYHGARVIFECQSGLQALLAASNLCDDIVERDASNAALPAPDGAVSLYVQSLPRLFGTDFSSIPSAVSYLRAPEDRIAMWQSRIDDLASPFERELLPLPSREGWRGTSRGGIRIAIVWAGNQADPHNLHRSCTLADYAPLAGIENVHFFSLQKGPHSVEAMSPPAGMRLTHFGDDLLDFADTAALIEQMDLVITVDTSVAHLAGALGKSVWTLLPWCSDWRWFVDLSDSPWYPTMRLFRQPFAGAWDSVFHDVATELRKLTGRPHN